VILFSLRDFMSNFLSEITFHCDSWSSTALNFWISPRAKKK